MIGEGEDESQPVLLPEIAALLELHRFLSPVRGKRRKIWTLILSPALIEDLWAEIPDQLYLVLRHSSFSDTRQRSPKNYGEAIKRCLLLHMVSSISRKNTLRMPAFTMESLTSTATCILPASGLLRV